jgi:hypothetical protein
MQKAKCVGHTGTTCPYTCYSGYTDSGNGGARRGR